ncbi:MAG TPA: hypothetical protein VMT62_15990 [Syntrophorhabdaceae bacterium]|nr:hypothetical protein [Syntrophorhabdaceae bacterium]
MIRRKYTLFLVCAIIVSSLSAFVAVCPLYAAAPALTDPQSTGTTPNSAPATIKQEFQSYSDSNDKALDKAVTAEKISFVRLKPTSGNANVSPDQKVYNIEFMDDKATGSKPENGAADTPNLAVHKIESLDSSNLMKKETAKENKTEVSLGYKLSPYSEIGLGKGFLIEHNETTSFQTRDDGWRFKFKVNF